MTRLLERSAQSSCLCSFIIKLSLALDVFLKRKFSRSYTVTSPIEAVTFYSAQSSFYKEEKRCLSRTMVNSTNATDTTSWKTLPAGKNILFFSALNISLSITASLGNILILIALCKVSSIYPPTNWLFGCLAVTDLCVGLISQPLYAIELFLFAGYIDMYGMLVIFFLNLLFVVLTSAAISVDRLLALLLRLRLKCCNFAASSCSNRLFLVIAVFNGSLFTALILVFFAINIIEVSFWIFIGLIILSITISTFCYITIFFTLRHRQAHLQDHAQPGQLNGGGKPQNIARYKKTVSSIAWMRLALL